MTTSEIHNLPFEMWPSRYIEKVSLATGEVLEDDFEPRRLLVHSHRDYHLVDIHARFMMSRVIKATGDENLARKKMKEMRRLGHRTSRILARMIARRILHEANGHATRSPANPNGDGAAGRRAQASPSRR